MTDTIQDRLRSVVFYGPGCEDLSGEAADVIDRLEQRIAELQDVGTKSIVDLQRAEKRIEELEQRLEVMYKEVDFCCDHHQAGKHIFTDDQINEAWERLTPTPFSVLDKNRKKRDDDYMAGARDALEDLGIVTCPRCGGTKVAPVGGNEGTTRYECDCPNNGWVMKK